MNKIYTLFKLLFKSKGSFFKSAKCCLIITIIGLTYNNAARAQTNDKVTIVGTVTDSLGVSIIADEIVITAYNRKQTQEALVGSVTTVKPSNLKIPASNLTNALAGQVAGMIAYQPSGQHGQDN